MLLRVFDGLSNDELGRLLERFDSLHLMRSSAGALVGLNSFRFVDVTPRGFTKPVTVLNHFAGILPQHRGGHSVMSYLVREGLRFKLAHPRRRFFYFCRFIHPSPYRLFVKYGPSPYPSPRFSRSEEMNEIVVALAEELGYAIERNASGHHVARPAFRVREEKAGAERYLRDDEITRFFVEQCPRYREGQGLMVLMPLGARATWEIPARVLTEAARRRLRRAGSARRAPLEALELPHLPAQPPDEAADHP